MAIITLPDAAVIRDIEWDIDQPAQVNRSDWTKRRQVVDQPGPALWSATANFVVSLGAAAALAGKAFLVDLEGQRNTFRLIAVEEVQAPTGLAPIVDGGGQSGRMLALRGGTAGATLLRGHMMTVNDQLLMLMAPLTFGSDGKAIASFKPSLRVSPLDATAVEVRLPTALVALTTSSVGWKVDVGQQYQLKTITVEEAF